MFGGFISLGDIGDPDNRIVVSGNKSMGWICRSDGQLVFMPNSDVVLDHLFINRLNESMNDMEGITSVDEKKTSEPTNTEIKKLIDELQREVKVLRKMIQSLMYPI